METSALSQLEASYLAGEITESEYLFYSDFISPKKMEMAGGLRRSLGVLLILFSLVGVFASAALLYEEYIHFHYPLARLGCTLNAKISCADAFDAWQGHLFFGIPNAGPGLIIFFILVGLSGYLIMGGTLPRLLWLSLMVGLAAGMALVFWFLYISLVVFQALCPFCLLVWAAVINLFWMVLAIVLRQKITLDNRGNIGFRLVIRFWYLIALIEMLLIAVVIFSQLGLAVLGF